MAFADGFDAAYLETILTTGAIDHPVPQRIVRWRVLAQKKVSDCRNAPLLTGVTSTADEGQINFIRVGSTVVGVSPIGG
jgi:hypothetical protein